MHKNITQHLTELLARGSDFHEIVSPTLSTASVVLSSLALLLGQKGR